MATALNAFVVSIAVDSNGVIKGIKDATGAVHALEKDAVKSGKIIDSSEKKKSTAYQKSSKSVRQTGKDAIDAGTKAADAFSAFRREAFAAFALFTDGRSLKAFLGDVSSANIQMGNLKNTITNIPTEKFIQMGAAVHAIDGNVNDPANWLTELQSEGATVEGRQKLNTIDAISLGLDHIVDNDGNPRADLFEAIAHSDIFKKLPSNEKRYWLSDINAPEGVQNLLTRPDFDKQFNQFSGYDISDKDIAAAQSLSNSWEHLRLEAEKFSREVYSGIAPSLNRMIDSFIRLEQSNPQAIADGINDLAAVFDFFAKVLDSRAFKWVLDKILSTAGVSPAAKILKRSQDYLSVEEDYQKGNISGKDAIKKGASMLFQDGKESIKQGFSDAKTSGKALFNFEKNFLNFELETATPIVQSAIRAAGKNIGAEALVDDIFPSPKGNEQTSQDKSNYSQNIEESQKFIESYNPQRLETNPIKENEGTSPSESSDKASDGVSLLKIPSPENVETPNNYPTNLEALSDFLKDYQSKVPDIPSQNSETVNNIHKSYNSQISDASSRVTHVTNDNRSYTAEVHVHDIEYGGDPQVIANTIGKQLLEHWSHPEGGGLR